MFHLQEAPVPPASDIYAEVSEVSQSLSQWNIGEVGISLEYSAQRFPTYLTFSWCCYIFKILLLRACIGQIYPSKYWSRCFVRQAKNWAGELISGQTRAGKILVRFSKHDLMSQWFRSLSGFLRVYSLCGVAPGLFPGCVCRGSGALHPLLQEHLPTSRPRIQRRIHGLFPHQGTLALCFPN